MTSPQPPAGELWPIHEVANYLGCSESRARALLSSRGIQRVSGYPAEEVRQIQRRQGHRIDLQPPPEFGPVQAELVRCLGLPGNWTADRIANNLDPSPSGKGMRPLVDAGLQHLHDRGYAVPTDQYRWHLTTAGRTALAQLHARDDRSQLIQEPHGSPEQRQATNVALVLQEIRRIHGIVKHFTINYPEDEQTTERLFADLAALPELNIYYRRHIDPYLTVLTTFGEAHNEKLRAIFDQHTEAEQTHLLRSPVSIIIFELLENSAPTFQYGANRFDAITDQDVAFFQSIWGAPTTRKNGPSEQ